MIKKYITTLLCIIGVSPLFAQSTIEDVLKQIEENNPQIKSVEHLATAEKGETRATNNLANPTVSYAHLWDSKDSGLTESELEVAQSFEFPTAYIYRRKANKEKVSAIEAYALAQRQDILLQAKDICLDIIKLNQEKKILDQQFTYANHLLGAYNKMIEAGDATSLELNKVKLELLNIKSEHAINKSNLQKKEAELLAMNGNKEIVHHLTDYPAMTPLPSFEIIKEEVLANSFNVQAAQSEHAAARRQIAVNKAGWLPNLEVGYRRNSGDGNRSNGFMVGVSLPIFNNRGKVGAAKATELSKRFLIEETQNTLSSESYQAYQEAVTMQEQLKAYDDSFDIETNLSLLNQALEGGEISMTAYFVEAATVYQSALNYIQLSNLYQKGIAQLYKHRL